MALKLNIDQPRRACFCFGAALLAAALSGCVEIPNALEARVPNSAAESPRIAAQPGISPSGASVAFVTVEGAPASVVARFSEKTTAEAERREVAVTGVGAAHYLVRGYLSANAVEGGVAFRYVWDVFDRGRRRVQRTEDEIVVKGPSGDPWALASDPALTSLAARSADDLAAILSHMPEAAAAGRAPAAAAIVASVPGAPAPSAPTALRAFR